MDKRLCPGFFAPRVDRIIANVAEVKLVVTPIPNGTLGKSEALSEFFYVGVRRNEGVNSWVVALNSPCIIFNFELSSIITATHGEQ